MITCIMHSVLFPFISMDQFATIQSTAKKATLSKKSDLAIEIQKFTKQSEVQLISHASHMTRYFPFDLDGVQVR